MEPRALASRRMEEWAIVVEQRGECAKKRYVPSAGGVKGGKGLVRRCYLDEALFWLA